MEKARPPCVAPGFFIPRPADRPACGRDGVLLFGPRAQVDLLAAVRAERAVFVFLFPLHFFGAGRAGHYGHGYLFHQKLQSVSSNGTSSSSGFGFRSPPWVVKRTHSMYLLAEISGIAPSVS